MHSHTTRLLQLSEQVQTEIAERITNVIMNNIRDRNDELQTSQMK